MRIRVTYIPTQKTRRLSYCRDRYRYSSKIRQEIKRVFNEEISSETLRGLFKELKEQYNETALKIGSIDDDGEDDDEDDWHSDSCGEVRSQAHSEGAEPAELSASDQANEASNSNLEGDAGSKNRNADAVFYGRQWCSHPGLLLKWDI